MRFDSQARKDLFDTLPLPLWRGFSFETMLHFAHRNLIKLCFDKTCPRRQLLLRKSQLPQNRIIARGDVLVFRLRPVPRKRMPLDMLLRRVTIDNQDHQNLPLIVSRRYTAIDCYIIDEVIRGKEFAMPKPLVPICLIEFIFLKTFSNIPFNAGTVSYRNRKIAKNCSQALNTNTFYR